MENIITFASMTHAMKAREALRNAKIPSRMIRTPAKLRRGSCGYSLVVPKHLDEAVRLLRDRRIPFRDVFGDDVS